MPLRAFGLPLSAEITYEFPAFPSKPRHSSDAIRYCPALLDGYSRADINVLLKFLFVGRIRSGTCIWNNRVCNVHEAEKELTLFQRTRYCFLQRHLFSLFVGI